MNERPDRSRSARAPTGAPTGAPAPTSAGAPQLRLAGQPAAQDAPAPARPRLPRLLVAMAPARTSSRLKRLLAAAVETLDVAPSQRELEVALSEGRYDVVVLGEGAGPGARSALAAQLAGRGDVSVVVLAAEATLQEAIDAMRAGASDLIDPAAPAEELTARLAAAAARARAGQERLAGLQRLQKLCRRLDADRNEINEQLSSLCADLAGAYEEMTEQIDQVTVASEFGALVRQELDVESLLRTALEFVLAKVGPTNAAVFLPSTTGDWSLGAYINYDRPRETVDVLLDGLGCALAPRMARQRQLLMLPEAAEFSAIVGDEAVWLGDCGGILFSCHDENECLAVVCLFRDEHTPFESDLRPTIETIATLFGRQLGRIVHIHHRHVAKDQWGAVENDDEGWDDGLDLAA